MSQRKTRTMATDSPPPYHWLARQNRIPTWNLLVKCCRFLWNLLNIRCTLIIIIDMRMAIMSYRDWPLFHAMNNLSVKILFDLYYPSHSNTANWHRPSYFCNIISIRNKSSGTNIHLFYNMIFVLDMDVVPFHSR